MTTEASDKATSNRIVSGLDANLLVEAGAGTGKTYALVSRVVALIKSGKATMRGIVAITFTETAAAELSERIRSRMEQLSDPKYIAAGKDPLLKPSLTDVEKERIRKAIDDIDQASIQTIHSFAAQILRDRPMDAGLPPGWVTLDAIESRQLFDDAWDAWLDVALGQDGEAELQDSLRHLLGVKAGVDKWRQLARAFSENYDRLRGDDSIAWDFPDSDLSTAIATTVDELRQALEMDENRPGRSASLGGQISNAIDAILSAQEISYDAFLVSRAIRGHSIVPTGRGGNTAVKNRFAEASNAFLKSVQDACNAKVLPPLMQHLRQTFAVKYPDDRKADGVATFEDLLVWARDVLRDKAEARAHFQGRYSHILIDEFQDTDPLQAEIAFYLAARPDANVAGREWHSIPLQPGKLFIVGDAKQSIYRFRRADIGVTQLVKGSGQMESLGLSENRRSQKPVLEWVNAVFGRLMVPDNAEGPPVQAEYVPLQPNDDTQKCGLGMAQFFGGESDASTDQIRRTQAADVASLIAAAISESGGREVYDKGKDCIRPAKLGDVCILIRSRTGLGILERGLESANIPYRIEGGSLLFNTQEVQDLLNCLRAIDNPYDAVSVVAALRSPAFACSDADLFEWRDAGGGWNYTFNPADVADSPVAGAMGVLKGYNERHQTESVARLIAGFIRDRRLDELDLVEARPREMWRRRQFLVAQARSQEYGAATGGGAPLTLRRFIDWAETQQEENARIAEIAAPENDDDSVRIMTIHAAKGLEFPIVIMLGFGDKSVARRGNVYFGGTGESCEVYLSENLKTPGYDALFATEKRHSDAEYVRLAYVAATRARDHLLVSLHHKDTGSLAAQIDGISDLPHSEANVGTITALPMHDADDKMPGDPYNPDWQAQRETEIKARSRPQAVTATGIAKFGEGASQSIIEDKDAVGDVDTGPRRGRGGRSGTAFGSALHSVLQIVVERMLPDLPLPSGADIGEYLAKWDADISDLAGQQVAEKGVAAGRGGEIVRLAHKALHTPAVAAALCAAPRLWSEIPVAATIDGGDDVVVEGIIDLLYEDSDGDLVVIDYKSDDVGESDVDAKLERYQWQGAAYAAALESTTGKTVKEVQFLFVRLEQPLRSVGNLRELMAQLPDRIADVV